MKNDDPLIGIQLANFRVERLLGRGGMARVYYGRDVKLDRPVAIKIVDTRYWGEQDYARRFVEEARLIASWRHENIVQVYYADDKDNELYYFVMEFVDGQDLAQILADRLELGQLMPHADVLRIGWAIARALDYAHRKDVVHRDIKPSNVLVAKDGRVVLSDFGLALDQKRGSHGQAFGTPHYISPEQARRSSDAVPASDLYSFAVILYEMLTGVIPFDDPSSTSIALKHLSEPPPLPSSINPHLNAATDAVLLKALSKQPEDRFPNSLSLMRTLESALQLKEPVGNAEAVLPPPPALAAPLAIKPAEKRISLAERSAQLAAERDPLSLTQPGARTRNERRNRLLGLALLGLLIVGLVLGAWYASQVGGFAAAMALIGGPQTPTATASLPPTSPPSQTPTFTPTATATPVVVPTHTATPSHTASPLPSDTAPPATVTVRVRHTATRPSRTTTASPTAAATSLPTETAPTAETPAASLTPTLEAAAPLPTATRTPAEAASATPEPSPTATIAGMPSPTPSSYFVLYYDYNSFYLLNKSGVPVEYVPFAFERLDAYGVVVNRFDGKEWAKYAQRLPDQWCSRLEILQAEPYLNPWQCFNLYGATRNPPRTSEWIFWTKKSGSSEFRILWNEAEVARCPTETGVCEFWLPQP